MAEAGGLADVQDVAVGVSHDVDTGLRGGSLEALREVLFFGGGGGHVQGSAPIAIIAVVPRHSLAREYTRRFIKIGILTGPISATEY